MRSRSVVWRSSRARWHTCCRPSCVFSKCLLQCSSMMSYKCFSRCCCVPSGRKQAVPSDVLPVARAKNTKHADETEDSMKFISPQAVSLSWQSSRVACKQATAHLKTRVAVRHGFTLAPLSSAAGAGRYAAMAGVTTERICLSTLPHGMGPHAVRVHMITNEKHSHVLLEKYTVPLPATRSACMCKIQKPSCKHESCNHVMDTRQTRSRAAEPNSSKTDTEQRPPDLKKITSALSSPRSLRRSSMRSTTEAGAAAPNPPGRA